MGQIHRLQGEQGEGGWQPVRLKRLHVEVGECYRMQPSECLQGRSEAHVAGTGGCHICWIIALVFGAVHAAQAQGAQGVQGVHPAANLQAVWPA